MSAFEKSNWIWIEGSESVDQYAEFRDSFEYIKGAEVQIKLSCDGDYTLFVNGKYSASNQYGDFEHYKIYDEINVTDLLVEGENEISILVHHVGTATQRYRPASAGLIYEVLSAECVLAYSSEGTLSRQSPTYASGRGVIVTTQLGFSFEYDATKESMSGYKTSVAVDKKCTMYPRPIKKADILQKAPMKSVKTIGENRYLIDLGTEFVGLPVLEFDSDVEQMITVAWGEHIDDGCVRQKIGNRDFSYTYKSKKGSNYFANYMLRLACRYLEVRSQASIDLKYAGLLPQVYPAVEKPCEIENAQDRRIYDICVNTLKLCMMEHYVDCPWREQALYAFDSRNQMLCGYYAFEGKNAEYARANLKLIGQDRRYDGLLSICYPSGSDLAIPSFSLYYILEMTEYIDHTGDTSLAKELLPKMCTIMDTFLSNTENGLVKKFDGKDKWNFYDWSPYAEGTLGKAEAVQADLAINCLAVMALKKLACICEYLGRKFPYDGVSEKLCTRIKEEFWCENGMFTMHKGREEYTVLGNSLAVFSGVVVEKEAKALCERIVSGEMKDCSLSMKVLEYDALLMTDTDKYREFVLDEIRENYGKMIEYGSDTVWETIKGACDFGNAGSLCHGWSSVPVYIYHKLGIAR